MEARRQDSLETTPTDCYIMRGGQSLLYQISTLDKIKLKLEKIQINSKWCVATTTKNVHKFANHPLSNYQ